MYAYTFEQDTSQDTNQDTSQDTSQVSCINEYRLNAAQGLTFDGLVSCLRGVTYITCTFIHVHVPLHWSCESSSIPHQNGIVTQVWTLQHVACHYECLY